MTLRKIKEDPGCGHRIIITTIDIGTNKYHHSKNTNNKSSWNYKKAKWDMFQQMSEDLFSRFVVDNTSSSDALLKKFCNTILECAKKCIPRGKVKHYKPLWSEKLSKLKKDRDEARSQAEQTHHHQDIQHWRKLAAEFKKEITLSKKQSFQNFLEKLDYRRDNKKVHNFINVLNNKCNPDKKQPIKTNKVVTNDKQIANSFTKFYTKYFPPSKDIRNKEKEMQKQIKNKFHCLDTHDVFTQDFDIQELNNALDQLKSNKSPGPDQISGEMIKHLGNKGRNICLQLFNLIWHTSVPSVWKKSIIIPILKPNKSAENIQNYRPISLTSTLAKLMEKMICTRLNWFLENQNILTPAQAGFRQYQSTTQQTIKLSQEIKDSLDKEETVLAVFVDFKSAYDSVWRTKLLDKMHKIGINNNMLRWFYNFLIQRFSATRYGETISKFKQSKRGLPQGSVSSTILFNLMINDLPKKLKESHNINCALYADDLVIWTSLKRKYHHQLTSQMNDALRKLSSWCKENDMQVNTEKTNYQIFSLSHKTPTVSLTLDKVPITQTKAYKYLGITFDNKLTWKHHILTVTEKASRRLSILKRLAGSKWGCARQVLNTTYKTHIKPILQYGSETTITANKSNLDKLEKVQNQALRIITGAVSSTPISLLQGYTHNISLQTDKIQRSLVLYEKLKRLPNIDYWRNYSDTPRRLKTQQGFIQKVKALQNEYNLPLNAYKMEKLSLNPYPVNRIKIDCNMELMKQISKQDANSVQLKQVALETIYTKFPENEWIHIYTDGSKIGHNFNNTAGAGIYSKLFCSYISLGPNSTHFDGELEAINSTFVPH